MLEFIITPGKLLESSMWSMNYEVKTLVKSSDFCSNIYCRVF